MGPRTLLTLLAALALALPTAAQTEYKVPNHAGDGVDFVVRYWMRYTEGDVKVVIEESDGSQRAISEDDYASVTTKNASFSPAYSTVNSGGTVGVVIVPLDRGTKVESTITLKEAVGYVGAFVVLGAALGAAITFIVVVKLHSTSLDPGETRTPDP